MTSDTDRLWQGVHDDAPTDDQGRPIHPERGYIICGMTKTDATANNGRKRDDIPYCLQYAGAGTDRPTEQGGACSKHGGAGGAPEGWANGNARHLAYSKRMNEDDKSEFEAIVETGDGELIDVDEMADMLKNMIGFEYMRLTRAVGVTPGVDLVGSFACPDCGKTYRKSIDVDGDPVPTVDGCGGTRRLPDGDPIPCDYVGPLDPIDGSESVRFGDKAVERKEARVENLIRTYKKIAEGDDVNVNADVDATVEGGDVPIDVNITNVGVDLPDGESESDGRDGGDE